ncbi:MAG: extracellular solute-binding protein [Chloroflexota bacterium]|nr:extracellular solute-binding protein [Chloroflexota bacterium]
MPNGPGRQMPEKRYTRRRLHRLGLGGGVGIAGVGAVLAACGGPTGGTPAGPAPTSGPKEITYAGWSSNLTNPGAEATRNAFSEQFGGVKFEEQVTPWAEYINKQVVLMASDSAPDVVTSENEQFPAFAKGQLYRSIGPFLSKDKAVGTKDFYPQLTACYTAESELFCLPGDLAPVSAVFASKQVFDAAGVAIPSEAASANFTWDAIVELARKLTKPDGSQYGLSVEYFESLPYSGGAYYVNDRLRPTKGAMDDARWAKAIDLWVDWTTKTKIMPTAADRDRLGQKDWWALFAQNKVGMYITGPWQIGNFMRMEPSMKWDMFWVPRLQTGATRKFRTGGSGVGLTKNARNPDLAWEWVKFNNTKPGYEIGIGHNAPEVVRLRAHVPSTDAEVARLKKLGMANVDILVKGATDVLWWPFHAEWPRIRGAVINDDMNKMLRGEIPAAATLKEVNERLTRELQVG